MKFSRGKKCVFKSGAESRQTQAGSRMLKISAPRMALMNQAQTVSGRRGRVMPGARRSIVVTLKLSAFKRDATQKMATLTIQSVMAGRGGMKKVEVRPRSDARVAQNGKGVSVVKANSGGPVCSGGK